MAVAGRRSGAEGRRRPPRRFPKLLFLALAMTLLVIAVNSIVSSSAEGPDPALVFADRVRPAVDRSTRQAAALEELRTAAPTLGRDGVQRGLERLLRESRDLVLEVERAPVEGEVRRTQALLITCLATRQDALEDIADTVAGRFESGPPEVAIDALVAVGEDLAVSDRAYELFLKRLPAKARDSMPDSVWLPEESRFGRPEMSSFVGVLRAEAGLAQVRDVALVTVATEPSPVGTDGLNRVLPLTKVLKLQVVVANAGTVAEKRVPVEATVSSQGGINTSRQFVDLAAGQRMTVTLTLRPAPGGVLELKVRAGPVETEVGQADNEQVSYYVMR